MTKANDVTLNNGTRYVSPLDSRVGMDAAVTESKLPLNYAPAKMVHLANVGSQGYSVDLNDYVDGKMEDTYVPLGSFAFEEPLHLDLSMQGYNLGHGLELDVISQCVI